MAVCPVNGALRGVRVADAVPTAVPGVHNVTKRHPLTDFGQMSMWGMLLCAKSRWGGEFLTLCMPWGARAC